MKNILIYGASGHAKMIVDIILKNKTYAIKGFIDSYKPIGNGIMSYKILGNLTHLPQLINELKIEGIVIAVGDNYSRLRAYEKITTIAPQLNFPSIIHSSAIIALDVTIGHGSVIMANSVINANSNVGIGCILNTASTFGHDSTLGDFSSLASGVTVGGNVHIGNSSAICLGASIIHNIIIGHNSVVGAGSLVLKPIADYKQAFGSPVNTIKERKADSKYLG